MRIIDENRAKNYIRKHERYKKWLAFVLCLSLITGTVTLYIMNKPATAMTKDGARKVGLVLETADDDFEHGLIELMGEEQDASDEDEETGDDEDIIESSDEDDDEQEEETGDSDDEDDSEDSGDSADSEDSEDEDSEDDKSGDESSDAATDSSSEEDDASSEESSIEEEITIEEAKSVKLVARYVTKDGEEIAESQDMVITKEKEISKDDIEEMDGFFYDGAYVEDKEIVKVQPILDEKSSEDEESHSDEAAALLGTEDEENKENAVVITGYEFETKEGEKFEIDEDCEINFTFLRACEETEFSYSDGKVNVSVTTNARNVFPEGIELKVTELTPETENYNYDAYLDALNGSAQEIADEAGQDVKTEFSTDNTLMYDIAFIYEGEEIQPKEGSVNVSIVFMKKQLTDDISAGTEENLAVVHLPIKEDVKEAAEIPTTEAATDITADDIKVETLTDASAEVGKEEKVEFTSESFSVFAVISYPDNLVQGDDDFLSVLGDAVNFGIVTNDLTLSGDSQTNFAVKSIKNVNQQTGNDMTNPVEQTFIAADVLSSLMLKGETAYFVIPSERKEEYQRKLNPSSTDPNAERWIYHQTREKLIIDAAHSYKEITGIIDDLLAYTREASRDLDENRTYASDEIFKLVGDTYELDIRDKGPGTYYVELSDKILKYNLDQGGDKLFIYKNLDQNIVFRVTAKGDVTLKKYRVWDGSQLINTEAIENTNARNGAGDKLARSLIFNFVNEVHVTTEGSVAGVFITGSDKSTWDNGGSSSGWLVFPKVDIHSGEWHNTYDNVVKISETAKFEAAKTISHEDATVTGFKFTLSRKDGNGWTAVESAYNGKTDKEDKNGNAISTDANSANEFINPRNIYFSTITYGNDAARKDERGYQYTAASTNGATDTFIYKIEETAGFADSQGNAYNPDTNVYYAKVTVTCSYWSEYSKNRYWQVKGPEYFTDEACRVPYTAENVPVFDNTPAPDSIGLTLNKYLGGADPGDKVFSFRVRALKKDRSGFVELEKMHNTGSVISGTYDLKSLRNTCVHSYKENGKNVDEMYFVINEEPSPYKNISIDPCYIIVKARYLGTPDQKLLYFRYDPKNKKEKGWIEDINNNRKLEKAFNNDKTKKESNAKVSDKDRSETEAFYNEGSGMLKVHKMVVNEFSAKTVRDATGGKALLSNVTFRLTNLSDDSYIYFTGFTDATSKEGHAKERDKDHRLTKNTYDVYYNRCAQWTITGLAAGRYLVEEVGDGLTFDYDPKSNTSTVRGNSPYARVTKYCITVDPLLKPNEKNDDWKNSLGSNNKRRVFSVDLEEHLDIAPPATVGGDVETVQVCNYYSNPIGPIQIAKNFTGSPWNDEVFSFELTPQGGEYWYSEGKQHLTVDASTQPMPLNSQDGRAIATVSKDDQIDGKPGVAIARFENIPFRFEGNYFYKIKELIPENTNGITYDEAEYTVEIKVRKKWVQFSKPYTRDNMVNPLYYTSDTTRNDEDFYYLGADIIYRNSDGAILATCELVLPDQPDTREGAENPFIPRYSSEEDIYKTMFVNTKTGELTIVKQWLDKAGKDKSDGYTKLFVNIWRRAAGSSKWEIYGEPVMLKGDTDPKWTAHITDLPLTDDQGNRYEYTVKEADSYTRTFKVVYTYPYTGNQNDPVYPVFTTMENTDKIKVGGEQVYDTGYIMTTNGSDYGTVMIANTDLTDNTLPHTGGKGKMPIAAAGMMMILAAVFGKMFLSKKKENRN